MTHAQITPQKNPFFSNLVYDRLKFIAQIILPGLGTFYFSISSLWHLPFGTEIVGTITALDVLLGTVLLLSTNRYNKSDAKYDGTLLVNTSNPEKDSYLLDVTTPLYEVNENGQLVLKVQTSETSIVTPGA